MQKMWNGRHYTRPGKEGQTLPFWISGLAKHDQENDEENEAAAEHPQ